MGSIRFKRPVVFASTAAHSMSGSLTVAKTLTASSGATVTNTLTLSSHRDEPIQTASTNATALRVGGISTIQRKSSAGASTNLFTLAGAPIGTYKEILCINAGSTRTCRVTLGSGVSFYSSVSSTDATLRKATFNAGKEGLLLRAVTTAKYFIVSNLNSVAIATT